MASFSSLDDGEGRWYQTEKVGGVSTFVTAAYNSTVHSSTSFSPNFLLFGRELISSVDIAFGCPRPPSCTPNDYAFQVRERMAEAYALVRIHTRQSAQVNKQAYDWRVKPVSFQSGDLVWYFCPRTPLATIVQSGPATFLVFPSREENQRCQLRDSG